MKPVEQTLFDPPHGNCFAACVASILEIPLDIVPNLAGAAAEDWILKMNDFLMPFGLSLVIIPILDEGNYAPGTDGWERYKHYFMPGYSILSAQSPRYECLHSVVCLNGEIVWDPHPSRDMGIGQWKDVALFCSLNPAGGLS